MNRFSVLDLETWIWYFAVWDKEESLLYLTMGVAYQSERLSHKRAEMQVYF